MEELKIVRKDQGKHIHPMLCRCVFDTESVIREKTFVVKMTIDSTVLEHAGSGHFPSAYLGLSRVDSKKLYQCRQNYNTAFHIKPYSEVLYAFPGTDNENLLSLESLYASPYGATCCRAFNNFIKDERLTDYKAIQTRLKHEIVEMSQANLRKNRMSKKKDSELALIAKQVEKKQELLITLEHIVYEICVNSMMVQELCVETTSSKNKLAKDSYDVLIEPDCGGNFLRRSAWKTILDWQYITTNLNIHLLTTDHMRIDPNATMPDVDSIVDVIPTITLGVAAAHYLKFNDGGLRKILTTSHHCTIDERLEWLHSFQCSENSAQTMLHLAQKYPLTAAHIFNGGAVIKNAAGTGTDTIEVTKMLIRRYEISKRLDICASQMLGFVVTLIRTVLAMAITHRGPFLEVLSRSLRIGFLANINSMLTTDGKEKGMLEDMETVSLWLQLLTVRLVPPDSTNATAHNDSYVSTDDVQLLSIGRSTGTVIRRDLSQRYRYSLTHSPTYSPTCLLTH